MIGYLTTKPIQGVVFKRLWDHLMGVMEAQCPVPGNPKKDCEDKVITHDQKASITLHFPIIIYGQEADRNFTDSHRSVLEWVSLN